LDALTLNKSAAAKMEEMHAKEAEMKEKAHQEG